MCLIQLCAMFNLPDVEGSKTVKGIQLFGEINVLVCGIITKVLNDHFDSC